MKSTALISTDRRPDPGSWAVLLPVVPVPASRPRVTRVGRVYYGKNYTRFRNECNALLEESEFPPEFPLTGPLDVSVRFIVAKPKTTKRSYPRGDVDNYFKTLDVLNQVVWQDDDQIIVGVMEKIYGDPPRIELEITPIERISAA